MCYFIAHVFTTFITNPVAVSSLQLKAQVFKNHLSQYFDHRFLLNNTIAL